MNLSELQPKEVLGFFYEISSIPHGTYNVDQISDYLVEFAKKRNLKYRQDEFKNVIIWGPATEGYENEPAIAIQGHMDMVAVKNEGCTKNLETEGLDLEYENGYIYAKDTSLGGDDGIALAYALAILDSDSIPHPAIEAIFTVNEEVGMDGAIGIDLSDVSADRLLNVDSEVEGILTVSCAGGMRVHSKIPVCREEAEGCLCEITIEGLKGGHSGVEIHTGRGNGAHLMGRALYELMKVIPVRIVELEGGTKDNAIPCNSRAAILVDSKDLSKAEEFIKTIQQTFISEFAGIEEEISVSLQNKGNSRENAVCIKDSENLTRCLISVPDGVISMSGQILDLVETSLNLGIMKLTEENLELAFALRSSRTTAKHYLKERVFAITEAFGGKAEASGDYPSWSYRADSPLRNKMIEIFERQYGHKPEVVGIHAGLECGILIEKKPALDCVSLGPNLLEIHTTREKMEVESVQRTWEYIKAILAQKDNK